ncbi:hypothetical protein BJX62DRAFT_241533 [Aspergillus germanicus]
MDLGNVDDQVLVSSTGVRSRKSIGRPRAPREVDNTNILNINSDGESDESVDLGARPDAGAIDQPTQSRVNNGINPEILGGYNNNPGHVVAPHALNSRRTDSTSHSVARNGTHEPGLDLGTVHPDDRLIRLEATILRYFIEEIAPLFDACAAMILQLYEDVSLEKNASDDDVRRILTIFVLTQLPAAERFPHSLLELYYDRGYSLPPGSFNMIG